MKMENKVVMITGAAGCIGRATAECLAEKGAKLVLCDISEQGLNGFAQQLREKGCDVIARAFDVRDHDKAAEAVRAGLDAFGDLDVLINVAGGSAYLINKPSQFVDSEPSTWDFVLGINVIGSMNCTHAVLPHMIEKQKGKIIFFGSVAGVNGLPGRADYSAAKGALESFTKALAMEVGKYNINVNCVSPGAIHRGTVPLEHMTWMGPKGYSSGPESVAKLCLFLASEDSNFITGQNYQVDGGRTLGSR